MAYDWCDGTMVEPLARSSFKLHMELAKNFNDCDYRRVDTLSVALREGTNLKFDYLYFVTILVNFRAFDLILGKQRSPASGKVPSWITGPVTSSGVLGTTSTTAQVEGEIESF